MEGELDLSLAEPGDGKPVAFQCGFTEDRVVAVAVEGDGEAVGVNRHGAGGLDEPAIQLLWVDLLKPFQRAVSQRSQPLAMTVRVASRSTLRRTSLARRSRWKKFTLIPRPSSIRLRPA